MHRIQVSGAASVVARVNAPGNIITHKKNGYTRVQGVGNLHRHAYFLGSVDINGPLFIIIGEHLFDVHLEVA